MTGREGRPSEFPQRGHTSMFPDLESAVLGLSFNHGRACGPERGPEMRGEM